MSQPYLFYSERCPHSKQIIETLKALNKAGLYKFILVESLARDKIPSFLKKVPTLYNPESKEVIVGKDIFGYIAKPTNARKELPTKQDQPASSQAQGGSLDVSAWGFEGSGRLSESYSSWDTPTSFSSEGNSMYTFLGQGSVQPVSENTTPQKTSANNGDVSARLEALEKERKNEFSGISRV
jgi:glutaredoxin-related protein